MYFKKFLLQNRFTFFLIIFFLLVLITPFGWQYFFGSKLEHNVVKAGPLWVSESMDAFDRQILDVILIIREKPYDVFFVHFTHLGSWKFIVFLTFFLLIYFLIMEQRKRASLLVSASLGAEVVIRSIKIIVERPRPPIETRLAEVDGFSFPSGHALIASSFFGVLIYFFVIKIKDPLRRYIACFFSITFIILIGFSRVYLGLHWFSDVLVGLLLGFCWLLFGIKVINFCYRNR